MAGIYLHIPFCRQACHYCNFHFSTSLKLKNDFLEALLKEAELRRGYIGNQRVDTVYFGGGTPSLLTEPELSAVMKTLHRCYDISPGAEITLEANPDDITYDAAISWKNQGINRLSIGIQSFFEDDLLWMNRAHSAEQSRNCITTAERAGIGNLSIDLIYGGPTLTDAHWRENLETAVDFGISHLSCYALTVEPGTALASFTRNKQTDPISEDDQARQFLMMTDYLQAMGYEHYEISNFALPGKRSVHNSAYWRGEIYLGLGPSAHSFNGSTRQWNVSNNALYIRSAGQGSIPFESEILGTHERHNEYLMTSLRTREGIALRHVRDLFGNESMMRLVRLCKKFEEREWIVVNEEYIRLTREGKLFADGIASELFTAEVTQAPVRSS